jgi:Tol biopolymer transport system component
MKFKFPSWSPSGSKLAWATYTLQDNIEESGIAIFDLDKHSSTYLYPYNVWLWEVAETFMDWSVDESYILVINPEQETYVILATDGTYSRQVDRGFMLWSPRDLWLAREEWKGSSTRILIESPKGELIHEAPLDFPLSTFIRWSPDGRFLYIFSDDESGQYGLILDTNSWQYFRMDLPENILDIEWP